MYQGRTAVWEGRGATARPREYNIVWLSQARKKKITPNPTNPNPKLKIYQVLVTAVVYDMAPYIYFRYLVPGM